MAYRDSTYVSGAFDFYLFAKNIQGDILYIYNTSGTRLVTYTYDAWGKCYVTYQNGGASTSARYNPFRYRGYYYDTETGFYYLNSRYYDPSVGRFLNADVYINANGDILGFNMFAYCGNNPVKNIDSSGKFIKEFWEAFTEALKQAGSYFAIAGGVSQIDTFAIGLADLASVILLLGGVFYCAAKAINQIASDASISVAIPKAKAFSLPQAKEKEKTDVTQKISYYWCADIVGNDVVKGQPLDFASACLRVAKGKNVLCASQDAAMAIIINNRYRNYVGPEIGKGEGYYWHYHPTRNHAGRYSTHIWFYGDAIVK